MFALFSIGNHTNDEFTTKSNFPLQKEIIKKEEPYDITFKVEKLKNNTYNFIISMELEKDAHYVSPNSKGSYLGQFTMIMDKNTKLRMNEAFTEIPLSKESIDPWNGGPVNFVREHTTYTKQFTISDTNDFEVAGLVQFVIEPRCTLEKIHFKITNTSGNIEIKQQNTNN